MKRSTAALFIFALVLMGVAHLSYAQAGKPTIVDANLVTEADLAKLPHMNAALAKAVIGKRPFKSVKDLDNALGSLTKEQRTELYARLFVPINLNTASDEEILLIPGIGNRMLRHRERGLDAIREPDIEQHPLTYDSAHLPRLQIHHEERLFADDLLRVGAFLLHAREDRALVIAKAHTKLHQFVRPGDVVYREDGPYTDIDLLHVGGGDGRFDRSG